MKQLHLILLFILTLVISQAYPQNAPVTTAGCVVNATPGAPSVPISITVVDFNDIGQFTLTLRFDESRIQFVSSQANATLSGMDITYIPPSGNTIGRIELSWSEGVNVSLPDSSSIAELVFSYSSGTGILQWDYISGSVCEYKRWIEGVLSSLDDLPQNEYYLDGGISYRGAPQIIAPELVNPVPGTLSIPVTANNYTDITSMNLYLEYDPSVITYQSYSKNPIFGSSFTIVDVAGTNGNRLINVHWYNSFSPVTLPQGSTIFTINFDYTSPSCNASELTWYDNGPSCEYLDGLGEVLIDMPYSIYYLEGLVPEGIFNTWTGNFSEDWDDPDNWNDCGVPDSTKKAIIPVVSPNPYPIITTTTHCKSLVIEEGSVLTITPSGDLNVGP